MTYFFDRLELPLGWRDFQVKQRYCFEICAAKLVLGCFVVFKFID
ncbi:hypothetical protein SynSYN20_03191 [Synechococcus sp. SYN20]|nr:hypothetical protein SynSYN20_03191 [Synechococcus sp. SYN20]